MSNPNPTVSQATFAQGCFWCAEAIFQRIQGVLTVQSGYIGGTVPNPSYEDVCTQNTGHAEAVHLTFNPNQISYQHLLDIFWATHDPTTLNRQGNDSGTQYRSAIFYHDDEQKKLAIKSMQAQNESGHFSQPIVTQIVPFTQFYYASDDHSDYYNQHRNSNSYCQVIIDPKVRKLLSQFSEDVALTYLQ